VKNLNRVNSDIYRRRKLAVFRAVGIAVAPYTVSVNNEGKITKGFKPKTPAFSPLLKLFQRLQREQLLQFFMTNFCPQKRGKQTKKWFTHRKIARRKTPR
jgi:hypothetical protein